MRGTPFYYGDFSGGLNTRDAVYEVQTNQSRDLLNVTGKVTGAVRQRDGCTQLASTPAVASSLYGIEATSTRYLMFMQGTAIEVADSAGSLTTITPAAPPSAGTQWCVIQAPKQFDSGGGGTAQGPVFMADGVNPPLYWTGAGAAVAWTATDGLNNSVPVTSNALPNAPYMVIANNRVWAAGMSSYISGEDAANTVAFSEVGQPRTWPYRVQIDPFDGDRIMGLGVIGPYVIVFKQRKTYAIFNLDTGANRRISGDLGCASHRSIAATPQGLMFLGYDQGVCVTNGSTVQTISAVIQPTLDNIPVASRTKAAGVYFKSHYYLSCAQSGASNDTTLDYDLQLTSWWRHSTPAVQWATWHPTTGTESLYYADAGTARLAQAYQPNTTTDFTFGFVSYWTGSWVSPSYFRRRIISTSDYRKRLRAIRGDVLGKVDLNIAKDFIAPGAGQLSFVQTVDFTGTATTFGGTGTFGGAGVFGDQASIGLARIPAQAALGVARAFSVQWYSPAAYTQQWEVEEYVMLMGDRTD